MEGIAKIQTELTKGKTSVDVKERLGAGLSYHVTRVLTDGDAMLTRFNNAMEPIIVFICMGACSGV